jgi:hypothetical protein
MPKKKYARTSPKKKATARIRKNKPGAGRPHVSVDEATVARLAFAGCKNSEIAFVVGCDDQTLKNNYSRILDKKRAERKAAIRAKQTERALAGDTTLLIWLGKVELEQVDKQVQDVPGVEKAIYELSEKFLPVMKAEKKSTGRGHDPK